MLCWALGVVPCAARGAQVLVEIGDSAESLLDARATRRLVALELADIDVPPETGSKRPGPLFYRVLLLGHDVRVELWQRGEYLGARTVSGSHAEGQLGARRVALAAAELARRLQRKRQAQAEHLRVAELARAELVMERARGALDGPFAVRPSLELVTIGKWDASLIGPRLLGQWTFTKRARLDAGLAWLAGSAPGSANAEWLELSVAPMRRFSASESLDLDLGLSAAAAWLRMAKVRGVDAIPDQSETWSARVAAVLRLEPRLSRQVRFSVGVEGGLVLRQIPYQPASGPSQRLGGAWLGLDLGVVYTPR